MGKTSKWFRSLLGSKKSSAAAPPREKKKSKWGFSKSDAPKLKNEEESPYLDANKHAIAVAAATAAVAEAAVAAAHAAAEVVRLTSAAGSGMNVVPPYDRRRVAAVIKIQSAFRAYLAKRALRALKGLVKLQALVRGHIVRKQSADMLRRMQAMARIQARASSHRSYATDSCQPNIRFPNYQPSGVVNPRNHWPDTAKHGGYIVKLRTGNIGSEESSNMAPNWLNHWIEQYSRNDRQATPHDPTRGDDERSDKILEVDTWKPRQTTRRSNWAFPTNETRQECQRIISLPRLSAKLEKPNSSISSEEVSSVMSAKEAVWTTESSPRVHPASSRPNTNLRGTVFTPTRSECSRSLYGDYLSHPNYMAYTESSRAKVRSQSAPKQRMQADGSTLGRKVWDLDTTSEKGYAVPANHRGYACANRQGSRAPGAPNGLSSSYGY